MYRYTFHKHLIRMWFTIIKQFNELFYIFSYLQQYREKLMRGLWIYLSFIILCPKRFSLRYRTPPSSIFQTKNYFLFQCVEGGKVLWKYFTLDTYQIHSNLILDGWHAKQNMYNLRSSRFILMFRRAYFWCIAFTIPLSARWCLRLVF